MKPPGIPGRFKPTRFFAAGCAGALEVPEAVVGALGHDRASVCMWSCLDVPDPREDPESLDRGTTVLAWWARGRLEAGQVPP